MGLKWKAKAIVQKIISYLPQKEKINFFFQKHITKGVLLTEKHLLEKLGLAKDHLIYLKKYGETVQNKIILELGSGWYPIIPICFYLCDAQKVISIDIQSWMTKETQLKTIKEFKLLKDKGILQNYLPEMNMLKWQQLENIYKTPSQYTKENINEILGLKLLITDARKTYLSSNSIDFICSNSTFEHIYKDVLIAILEEFKRILKKDGIMSHLVDMSDHFAHLDKTITAYNFLKFSEKTWEIIDNSIQPQNRLRYNDYVKMYKSLSIPITFSETRIGNLESLKKIKLAKEFQKEKLEDLAIIYASFLSKIK